MSEQNNNRRPDGSRAAAPRHPGDSPRSTGSTKPKHTQNGKNRTPQTAGDRGRVKNVLQYAGKGSVLGRNGQIAPNAHTAHLSHATGVKVKKPAVHVPSSAELAFRARQSRKKRDVFITKLLIFLTFYTVISLMIVGLVAFYIKSRPQPNITAALKIVVDEKTSVTIPAESVYINNCLYIPYEKLNLLCGFSLSGDRNKITLIITSGNDYASFYRDSQLVYVGGLSYRLSAPVLFRSDDYYIPAEFVENYLRGINVRFDEEDNIYTVTVDGSPITFAGKFPAPTEKIDVRTLPEISETSGETSQNP